MKKNQLCGFDLIEVSWWNKLNCARADNNVK